MKWIVLAAAAFLVGCTSYDTSLGQFRLIENQHFYHEEGSTRMTVQWIRVSDQQLQRICALTTQQTVRLGSVFFGCAGYDSRTNNCVIYTSTNTSHQIFGHELRHCFQGNFHK
jgi:hypothetical protein